VEDASTRSSPSSSNRSGPRKEFIDDLMRDFSSWQITSFILPFWAARGLACLAGSITTTSSLRPPRRPASTARAPRPLWRRTKTKRDLFDRPPLLLPLRPHPRLLPRLLYMSTPNWIMSAAFYATAVAADVALARAVSGGLAPERDVEGGGGAGPKTPRRRLTCVSNLKTCLPGEMEGKEGEEEESSGEGALKAKPLTVSTRPTCERHSHSPSLKRDSISHSSPANGDPFLFLLLSLSLGAFDRAASVASAPSRAALPISRLQQPHAGANSRRRKRLPNLAFFSQTDRDYFLAVRSENGMAGFVRDKDKGGRGGKKVANESSAEAVGSSVSGSYISTNQDLLRHQKWSIRSERCLRRFIEWEDPSFFPLFLISRRFPSLPLASPSFFPALTRSRRESLGS